MASVHGMPLFGETDDERREKLQQEQRRAQEMEGLEVEKRRLFEELARIGEEQKAKAREVYAVEKEQRERLKETEEHLVPEGQSLTHAGIEKWADTVYWSYARTNPGNPHKYVAKKRCEHPEMYERVVAYVLAHGYEQFYGGDPYTCYDVTIHGVPHFVWPMTDTPSESEVFNAKPASMRPE